MEHKQFPFIGCVIALHGFTDNETEHVKETAVQNGTREREREMVERYSSSYLMLISGAVICNFDETSMTHLIVADGQEPQDIPATPSKVFVVRQQVSYYYYYYYYYYYCYYYYYYYYYYY